MPICSKCKIHKDQNDFYFRKTRNKFSTVCKKCQAICSAKNALLPERKKNKRFSNSKYLAKRKNKSWDFSKNEYEKLVNQPCAYCNDFFKPKPEYGIGLDRQNNLLGYSVSNCVSCCGFCNRTRSNLLSPKETHLLINKLINLRKGII